MNGIKYGGNVHIAGNIAHATFPFAVWRGLDRCFFFFSILCRAAFNAAYSHTGGQARELVRS